MTPPEFASFKYQHTDKAGRSKTRIAFTLACLVAAVGTMVWIAFPVGAVLLVVALIA